MKKKLIIGAIVGGIIAIGAAVYIHHKANEATLGTPKNPYTIQWYTIGNTPVDLPLVEQKLNEYLIPRIGAKVDIHFVGFGQYTTSMNQLIMSGVPFDLCFTSGWALNYEQYAKMGAFYPMNDLLNQYGQGILKTENPAFLKGPQINGKLYGLPTNKEAAQQLCYVVNTTLAQKVGFDVNSVIPNAGLKTLQSLEPFMKLLKNSKIPGVLCFNGSSYSMPNMSYIMGTSDVPGAVMLGTTDYKVINQWETPEFMAYLEYYRHLYLSGYISSDAVLKKGVSNTPDRLIGISLTDYQPASDPMLNIGNAKNGWQQKSIGAYNPIVTTQVTQGALTAISVNAPRPDIDMKFLNLLNSDPYVRNLIGYGVQGVDYNLTSNDRVNFTQRGIDRYQVWQTSLGNLFLLKLLPTDPADRWQQFISFNNSATYSPIFGFHFDTAPVQNQIVAIQNIAAQYEPTLYNGLVDPKIALPKMIAAMNAAGLQKVLAEMQKQLNEWVAQQKAAGTLPVSKAVPMNLVV